MKNEKLKNFEIVCNLDKLTELDIVKALNVVDESKINHLVKYAYILHDKDKNPDGTPKVPHWHILIKMDNSYNFKYIANRFNVPTNFVQKIKTTFPKALNYLTHNNDNAKMENKYLYDDSEVQSNFSWKKERETAIKQEDKRKRVFEIMNGIVDGTIRKYNYFDYITIEEFSKFKRQIDYAFEYRIDKLRRSDRKMDVIYINGKSGCGKTTYAKQYAKSQGYSIFVSSGSNDVLDGYSGEDCIILDDLRPSVLALSDLLKLLDNHTQSSVKSRYKNKFLECKLIIITSVLDIDKFFKNVFKEEAEPIKQLKRRCKTMITIYEDYINVQLYDEVKETYLQPIQYKNKILGTFEKETYNNDTDYENATKKFDIDFLAS